MRSPLRSALLIAALAFSTAPAAVEVSGWVPYYGQDACYDNLTASYGGINPGDVMTSVNLQFWRPAAGGTLELVEGCGPYVSKFRDWGAQYGVKMYLTVFNNWGNGWDWNTAAAQFRDNKTQFINTLVTTMEDEMLDGIDLDIEGVGNINDDGSYASFVSDLSAAVKAKGKNLVIATYAGDGYGGPNVTWWDAWGSDVDFVRPMLYNEGTWYSSLKSSGQSAGIAVSMGLPAWLASWNDGGTPTGALQTCLDLGVGVALWDLQLESSAWKTAEVWGLMKEIHDLNGSSTQYPLTVTISGGGSVSRSPNSTSFDAGTVVTLTATANSGYTFSGWSGAVTGSQASVTVTMDAAKSVTATFTPENGQTGFDLVTDGGWITAKDPASATVDTSRSSTSITVDWSLPKKANDDDYPWMYLQGSADGSFTGLTSITVTYSSTTALNISLPQPGLSDSGASFTFQLEASSSLKTVNIPLASFAQPDWVSPKTALSLSTVSGIEFSPGVEPTTAAGVSGSFTVAKCEVFGTSLQATGLFKKAPGSANFTPVGIRLIGGVLQVSGVGASDRFALYDCSGREIFSATGIADQAGIARIPLTGVATGMHILRVISAGKSAEYRVPSIR